MIVRFDDNGVNWFSVLFFTSNLIWFEAFSVIIEIKLLNRQKRVISEKAKVSQVVNGKIWWGAKTRVSSFTIKIRVVYSSNCLVLY